MYTNKDVAKMANITPRLLIDLTEKGIVKATIDKGGKGSTRRYSKKDLFFIALYKKLSRFNISYKIMREIVSYIDDERDGYLIFGTNDIEIVPKKDLVEYLNGTQIVIDLEHIAKSASKMLKKKIVIKRRS